MRWSEKLLSNEYQQGKVLLWDTKNNTYCCLGVLCDIHPDVKWETFDYDEAARAYFGAHASTAAVPETIALETGLHNKLKWWESTLFNQMGVTVDTKITREAALQQANDSGMLDFKRIGAIILLLGWDVEIDKGDVITND